MIAVLKSTHSRRHGGGRVGVVIGIAFAIGSLMFGSEAAAQGSPLPAGSLVVGAERMMGVSSQTFSESQDMIGTSKETVSYTTVALFGASPVGGASVGHSMVPRIGFDGVFGPGVTVGASAMYTRASGESNVRTSFAGFEGRGSADQPTVSQVVLHPRVGYALRATDSVAVWPRVGMVYSSVAVTGAEGEEGADTTDDALFRFTNLSVEVLVVMSPVRHVGIVIGPFFDAPLSGRIETGEEPTPGLELRHSYMSFGVVAGIALIL